MAKRGASPGGQPSAGKPPAAGPRPDAAAPVPATPPPSADETLVAAFHELRDELVSTLLYLLGDKDDAQDAAQEAFLKCWRARAGVPGIHNLRAWIFRVGLNAAKDYQRSAWNRRAKPLLGDEVMLPDRLAPPGDRLDDEETLHLLRQAITTLRPEEQEVFLLRQNGDLTYEQIAELRDSPVGTVKTQMRSALIKLRRVLNPGSADRPAD